MFESLQAHESQVSSHENRVFAFNRQATLALMKKIYFASLAYLFLGLGFGVFYREFTKVNHFPESGVTQLSLVHTHLLTLGFMFLLIVLVLEKLFELSAQPLFTPAFWLFNAGLVLSTSIMVWHGIYQVLGKAFETSLSGIAGVGHIAMSLGILGISACLGNQIFVGARPPKNLDVG